MLPVLSVPGLLPGLIVPPGLTVTAPTVPEPPRVPVLLMLTAELAREPLTTRAPPLTAVVPP